MVFSVVVVRRWDADVVGVLPVERDNMRSERRGTKRGLVARLGGSREVVGLDFCGGGKIRRRRRRRREATKETTGRGKGVTTLLVSAEWKRRRKEGKIWFLLGVNGGYGGGRRAVGVVVWPVFFSWRKWRR
ncbi:hypothetical protein HAX54_034994, partial [Datura stramonium]|nr:hypothetical protein [Datura stramonium]